MVDDVSAGVWVVVNAAVTLAAVVTIFEHIVDPSMDGVQNVFSLSALGEETSTYCDTKEKSVRDFLVNAMARERMQVCERIEK